MVVNLKSKVTQCPLDSLNLPHVDCRLGHYLMLLPDKNAPIVRLFVASNLLHILALLAATIVTPK